MIELNMAKFNVKNPQTGEFEPLDGASQAKVQSDWNQTDNSADDYIKNKPAIPTVNDAALTIQKNGAAVGTFSANAVTAATINITVPVDAEDVGALPNTTKYGASLSLSINSTTYVVTASLKDQNGNTLGTAQTIDLPLETVVVGGSYDDTTKKVILTLKNGNTIDFSVADLVAGLQTEITSTNKLDADLVDDTASAHKFVTAADKTAWNAKSDFSGDYDDLTNKPTLGTAAAKGVDTAPTASSTNLVESGGVRNVVDVLEQMNGAKNRVNINASEVKSLNSAPGYTWNRNSCTVNGVTFTINNDNTITTSGATQSDKAAIFTLCDFGSDGTSEFYGNILSGCARGGNYFTSYSLYLVKPDGNTLINNDNSNRAGTEIPKTGLVRYLRILFRESTSADNLTFKPMICTKAAWDAGFTDFQPYALPVTTLTPALIKQVDEGAKNLAKFDIWAKKCSLVRGTKTIGSDGAITITATSSDCYTLFSPTDFPAECRIPVTPGQEMVATWTASMTGSGNKYLYIFPNGGTTGSIAVKASDGIQRFTVPENCTYITWRIGCSTSGDTLTINNLMICTKADYDASSAYVPYALPNTTITPALIKQVDEGAKNKFDIFNAVESKSDTITRTINADGTVTVSNSGSNTTPTALTYQIYLTANIPYVISGCPSGGSDSGYSLEVRTASSAQIGNIIDYGSGSNVFTVSTSGIYLIYLRIGKGYAFSNKVFKPMICTAEDWVVSHEFVPHAPTNRELYEAQADSIKLVYSGFPGENSRTVTYQMASTDFTHNGGASHYCGIYLIVVVNWSTSPSPSIYTACYSGGTVAYHALTKIGGADAQLTIDENAVITYTGKGKIQIYALQ